MSACSLLRRLAQLLAALIAIVVLVDPVAARAETRVALIIANSRYAPGNELTNPPSDARLIEASLRKAGFGDIVIKNDLGHAAMIDALKEFGNKADHADVALVYYAGHGVEVDHVNYLVPTDVVFAHPRDVDIEAVKLDTVLSYTENARRLRLVIIDACRESPYFTNLKKSSAGVISKGLQAVDPSKDLLVVFSAKGNTVAFDGRVNSPFAEALAQHIVEPGREVNAMFRQVRDDVMHRTNDIQEPAVYGSSADFYFIAPVAVAAAPAVPAIDIESETWSLCKSSLSRGPCDAYLASYGTGRFAALVRTRIADLSHASEAADTMAANLAAARAASAAATNAANLAATYAANLAANTPGGAASGGATRSATIGPAVGAPASNLPGFAAVPAATSVPATIASTAAPVVQQASPSVKPTVTPAPPPPVVPTSARVGDLGITVRYDKVAKGILVDAIDRNATFVAGKLFLGDLIMKIGSAVPDAAQSPDAQLAANWKSDGRLKLLVKRGDAMSVVMILGN